MDRLQWDTEDRAVRIYAVKDGELALTLAVWPNGRAASLELHTAFRLREDRSTSPMADCRVLPGACWSHTDTSETERQLAALIGQDRDSPAPAFWAAMEAALTARAAGTDAKRLPAGEELVQCPTCKDADVPGYVEARTADAEPFRRALQRILDEKSDGSPFAAWAHQVAGEVLGWPGSSATRPAAERSAS